MSKLEPLQDIRKLPFIDRWILCQDSVKCQAFYCLKRSQRCFSVRSVVTFPTHRDGQGLLREKQNALNGKIFLSQKHYHVIEAWRVLRHSIKEHRVLHRHMQSIICLLPVIELPINNKSQCFTCFAFHNMYANTCSSANQRFVMSKNTVMPFLCAVVFGWAMEAAPL